MTEPVALLVLGARVMPGGDPSRALCRRLDAAEAAARAWPQAVVIACGGRAWTGFVEADVMARELERRGVDVVRIERERVSLTTLGNLVEGSARVRARGLHGPLGIVSCAWHLPRARAIATALGVQSLAFPAHAPPVGLAEGVFRGARERISERLDLLRARRLR